MTLQDVLSELRKDRELVVEPQASYFAPVGRHFLRRAVPREAAVEAQKALRPHFYTRSAAGKRVLTCERKADASFSEIEAILQGADWASGQDTSETFLVLDQPYYSVKELAGIVDRTPGSLLPLLKSWRPEYGGRYDLKLERRRALSTNYPCTVVLRTPALIQFLREVYDLPAALPPREDQAA